MVDTYEAGDQLTQITYPDSSQITYEYNKLGQVENIPGYFDFYGIYNTLGFEYEPWGALAKMTHVDTCFTTTFEYNKLNFLEKILNRNGMLIKWGRNYNYNDGSMIDTVRTLDNSGDPSSVERTYEYDYLYRLTEAGIDSSFSMRYGYDQSGNR